MSNQMELRPSKIRFMHHSINPKFRNGKSVEDTIRRIQQGLMNVNELPTIRVVRKDGFYYAFDNRRLYVYRVLEHRGKLNRIRVKLAPLSEYQPHRFSTENNGESVILKYGETTLPHARATDPASPET